MKVKLCDVFDLQMGKTPSRNNLEYWNGEHKWVAIGDLGDTGKYISHTKECISDAGVAESGIKPVPAGTVIMSFKLSIGKTAITSEEIYTNEAIMAFIDKNAYPIDVNYIYHLFSGMDWYEGSNKAVMGVTLNKATLSQKTINIPDINEQRSVALILDKLDDLIFLRKQQLAKLDELVKARFVEMFGDPVQNPLCWKTHSLFELGDCKNGMNYHTDDLGINIHCLGVGDFKDLSAISDVDKLPTISLNEIPSNEYMLQDGDIVFVRSNGNKALVGRSIIVYPGKVPTTFSGFCIRFRINNYIVLPIYLLMALKTDSIRKKMAGRGANIQNLNQKTLSELIIPIPPLNRQQDFSKFIKQINRQKLTIQQSLDKLEVLKKSLMQEYFGYEERT